MIHPVMMRPVDTKPLQPHWRFAIDVGGTFTDVLARDPDGRRRTLKILSTGRTVGRCANGSGGHHVVDPARTQEPAEFWNGAALRIFEKSEVREAGRVVGWDAASSALVLDRPLPIAIVPGTAYELDLDLEAPILAIRLLMACPPPAPLGPLELRLGTTLATNALLERRGARVAFITTAGFGDVLDIGYQDRPDLFNLNIIKRDQLYQRVIEARERINAEGEVLQALDEAGLAEALAQAKRDGLMSAAICLLHATRNPIHEKRAVALARAAGFAHVAASSDVAPMPKLVPRADTTVLEAYLAPVLQDYLARLRAALPHARILLMTQEGGLVPTPEARAKNLVLSGPAGGVVGCAAAAARSGNPCAIGLDMGGTSTDVCRVGGFPDYELETVKSGIRIVGPILDIETIAAGGGSICDFDGRRLAVGPRSAGADPGPACYGRGGPLTLTDIHAILGRLPADAMPIPLDLDAAHRRLAELANRAAQRGGTRIDEEALAVGLLRLADDNMVRAIQRISIEKGHDPREHALVAFGGAAGLHMGAIAEALGIRRIICHPYAGLLSAYGIENTPVKRVLQSSVDVPLDSDGVERLHQQAENMTAEARRFLEKEEPDGAGTAVVTAELEYQGQSSTVAVRLASFEAMVREFEERHERRYGFHHPGRPIIARVLRVEATTDAMPLHAHHSPPVADPEDLAAPPERALPPPAFQDAVMPTRDSAPRRCCPYWRREDIPASAILLGPCIIGDAFATWIVNDGWRLECQTDGTMICSRASDFFDFGSARATMPSLSPDQRGTAKTQDEREDPVELSLFAGRLTAAAEQMGKMLQRTALSVNVRERLDFSCALFTANGDLMVNAPHVPVHLGGMSHCVKALIEDVGRFDPGDVYVTNDPFRGGSHLNDVTVVTPVFLPGEAFPHFFAASRAHHAEIGGVTPGSMPPHSRRLVEEGVILRATPLLRAGRSHHGELRARLCAGLYPSRSPEENLADINAQAAANRIGVEQLTHWAAVLGAERIDRLAQAMMAISAEEVRSAIDRLRLATTAFSDAMDDGATIWLTSRVESDRLILDFSGTSPKHSGNLNANAAIVTSAVIYALRCLIGRPVPLNAGLLKSVAIRLPPCFLDPPLGDDPMLHPAIVGGNVETSQRIVDVILGALGIAAASQGTMNNVIFGDERFGYYETLCGGAGAGPGFDGASAVHTHMTNTRITDVELLESRYPVRIRRFVIRRGSGGPGLHCGGDGVIREFEFLRPLELSLLTQRRLSAPFGLSGGKPGLCGRNRLIRADKEEELPPIAHRLVGRGDHLIIETPGGGGYGEPFVGSV